MGLPSPLHTCCGYVAWCFCGSGGIFDYFGYSWHHFPPVGLPCPAPIVQFMPNLTLTYYAMFSGYSWEICSFLKGNGEREDVGERGVDGGKWED